MDRTPVQPKAHTHALRETPMSRNMLWDCEKKLSTVEEVSNENFFQGRKCKFGFGTDPGGQMLL